MGYKNYGQWRRQQAFEAKRQRDLLKAQERSERDYWRYAQRQLPFYSDTYRTYTQPYYYSTQPDVWFGDDYSDYARYTPYTVYTPVYRTYDYGYNYYPLFTPNIYNAYYDDGYYYGGYDNGLDWKSLLFRTVISAFFSNGDNIGYFDPYPQYATYYNDGYYGYIPQYRYQPPYYTFGYAPTYAYYEPAAYYGYDQFAYDEVPYDYIADGSLPYTDMVEIYSGGLAGELIQRALVTGYYQGLLEGQLARERGWGDDHYYDPYLYEQVLYDPYSSSMGNCRRYLSEGYEIGYRDALAGRDDFDLYEGGGDIDLVSMLVGSTLSLRS
jgi:hypothetical protein